jgi:hypothetical protein
MNTPSIPRRQRRHGRQHKQHRDPATAFRLPPAKPARADFHVLLSTRYVLLVPASTRGAWFLCATPLADPPQLIPRIGAARLLRPDYAAALLPALADHFRLRHCCTHASSITP